MGHNCSWFAVSQPSNSRTFLNAWTVPNIITEPTASSPYGARYLNDTVNALLNIPKTSPLVLSPSNCTILAGFASTCTIRVSFSRVSHVSSLFYLSRYVRLFAFLKADDL